ncbi:MAG: outer membrane beta-barrel protein [Chitinophagaceae bacterium]
MKPPFFIVFLLLFINIFPISAQQNTYVIYGKVLDSVKHTPLPLATVYVKNPVDSTMISYTLTNEDGSFILKNIPKDESLYFAVFYIGYQSYHFTLKEEKDKLDLKTIYLPPATNILRETTIIGEAPPIIIKGDTIEFNASSFKVHPNSVLSDLLSKLPGVEVSKNGDISAFGERVDRILVQGKTFFGNDPKIALQNLPSAIVNKVQITDTKTPEEELTGEPASGNTKTINLILKKGLDHGFFGRTYAGGATGKHYDASALLNYFEGSRQISLLGAANNINQVGFTLHEMMNMMGRGARYITQNSAGGFGINGINFGNSNDGLKTSKMAGVNYNDAYGKHLSVNGNYFYGDLLQQINTQTERQNILPDSVFYYTGNNQTYNDNLNHRMSASISYKDSLWNIFYVPDMEINSQQGTNLNAALSNGTKGGLIYQSNSLYTTKEQNTTLGNRLDVYRIFGEKGQYLNMSLNFYNQSLLYNNYNKYKNVFYSGTISNDSVNQYIHNNVRNNNYNGELSYTRPLNDVVKLNIGYAINWQHGLTNKNTYNYNYANHKYEVPDTNYTNEFRSNIITQTPKAGLIFTIDSSKWSVDARVDFNFIKLHHFSFTQNMTFEQSQFFITPDITLTRQIKGRNNMSIRYYSYTQQPDVSQLFPLADNSNPLFVTKGNPNLQPSINRNIQFTYGNFSLKSGNNIWVSLSYFNIKNDINNIVNYDDQLRQLTTYLNVNGDNGFSLYFNISKIKNKPNHHWNINIASYSNTDLHHTFINNIPYSINGYNIGLHPAVTYGYKDLFEVTPSYRLNYQYSKYNIKALNNRQNIMQQGEFSAALYWPWRISWVSDWTYTNNSSVSPGFRKAFWLWNASVAVALFKNKRGSLQFSVYDLLNQDINVQSNISNTYIEETQTINLRRYFMLKFIYNLRKFTEKKKQKSNPIFFF